MNRRTPRRSLGRTGQVERCALTAAPLRAAPVTRPAMLDAEDPRALATYLIDTGRLPRSSRIAITNLAGGVSNKTVLVEHEAGAWVIKQALAKLRVEADWYSDPARIHREAAGMRALAGILPQQHLAGLVFEDKANQLLAMEAVAEPYENFKQRLLRGAVNDVEVGTFGTLLGLLHERTAGNTELASEFADCSFFESLRLEPYYGTAVSRMPETAFFIQPLMDATRATRSTLVHGDYSPKNVLVRLGTLVLLDHEVMHYGDPAFDVGFALAHLLGKANHLARHRALFKDTAMRFWQCYVATYPASDMRRVVKHALACLLARVVGKSPLEYLTTAEQDRQVSACLGLLPNPPREPTELIHRFCADLSDNPRNA
ncbi:MAG: hypothetical protein CMQ29_10610 [Gammaproteobacteria bacterium]|nr:hypothetical protein [Gammaproteobacteria bacterium]